MLRRKNKSKVSCIDSSSSGISIRRNRNYPTTTTTTTTIASEDPDTSVRSVASIAKVQKDPSAAAGIDGATPGNQHSHHHHQEEEQPAEQGGGGRREVRNLKAMICSPPSAAEAPPPPPPPPPPVPAAAIGKTHCRDASVSSHDTCATAATSTPGCGGCCGGATGCSSPSPSPSSCAGTVKMAGGGRKRIVVGAGGVSGDSALNSVTEGGGISASAAAAAAAAIQHHPFSDAAAGSSAGAGAHNEASKFHLPQEDGTGNGPSIFRTHTSASEEESTVPALHSRSPPQQQFSMLSFRDMYEDFGSDSQQQEQQNGEGQRRGSELEEDESTSHDDILQEYFNNIGAAKAAGAVCARGQQQQQPSILMTAALNYNKLLDRTPPSSLPSTPPADVGLRVGGAPQHQATGAMPPGISRLSALLAPSPAPPPTATATSSDAEAATAAAPSSCMYDYSGPAPSQHGGNNPEAPCQPQHQQQGKQVSSGSPVSVWPTRPPTAATADNLASSVTSSTTLSPSSFSYRKQQQPVLYSAIGSLEDPSGNSFASRYSRNMLGKKSIEFRNQQQLGTLLPPPNQAFQAAGINAAPAAGARTASNAHAGKSALRASAQASGRNRAKSSSKKDANPEKNDSVKDVTSRDQVKREGSVHDGSPAPPPPPPNNSSGQSKKASNLKKGSNLKKNKSPQDGGSGSGSSGKKRNPSKKVTIAEGTKRPQGQQRKSKKQQQPQAMFRPSSDAYTPRMGKKVIKYKPAEMRTPVQQMASPLGTLSRPNFKDALRRVAMIIHQHIVKITRRFENKTILADDGLFTEAMRNAFCEEQFATPTYKCTMVRVPMARPGMVYGLKKIRIKHEIPSEGEIYEFAHRLFKTVQLSSECSIVCLIYIERLMETAKVPLLADTWRPIFMCGLLLASKVWQDLSSWNIEFASVYPQYSLDSINRLELQFLRMVKWDLYISSSAYAKYYFALRSLVEKPDFRQRYNRMVGGVDSVQASEALKIEKRSSQVKEEALLQLSRSM